VPGIGKRTAERVIVELREKVGERGEGEGITVSRGDDPRYMAREALMGLGFTLQEAERLLAGAAGESAEELIEGALRARAAA
jgi:Holliday junction DNA helicase RuvA